MEDEAASAVTAEASGPAVRMAYNRLSDVLRRGVYAQGARLPGERDLAAQVGVSRATLRQALMCLAEEGRLQPSSQRGWFVSHDVIGEPPSVLQSFSEMARSRGLRPTARILHQGLRAATFDEAARLRIAPASTILAVDRLRGMDEIPICLDANVLVAARVQPLIEADLTDQSLYNNLQELCGVTIDRSSYAVQAEAANAYAAELLDLDEGAPVLTGHEITYDSSGAPVLISTTTYRGDAYRFEADLYRPLSSRPPLRASGHTVHA